MSWHSSPLRQRGFRLSACLLAGTAFGPGGAGHLRMCYATEPAELERALGALRRFVGKLAPVPAA